MKKFLHYLAWLFNMNEYGHWQHRNVLSGRWAPGKHEARRALRTGQVQTLEFREYGGPEYSSWFYADVARDRKGRFIPYAKNN